MSDRYICLFLLFGFGFCSVVANSNHDVGTLVERVKTLEIDQSDLKETVRKLQEVVSSQQDTIKYQERQIQKLLDLEQDKNGRGSDQQKRIEDVSFSPVAFSAYINHPVDNLVPGTVIPFEMVTTNEGNAFDGNKGVFSCPSAGLYLFVWNLMVDTGHNTQVYLAVNGAKRRWSYAYSTGSYANAANHDIVRLQEGDKVWIADDYASGEIHPHHTTFSGVLLF